MIDHTGLPVAPTTTGWPAPLTTYIWPLSANANRDPRGGVVGTASIETWLFAEVEVDETTKFDGDTVAAVTDTLEPGIDGVPASVVGAEPEEQADDATKQTLSSNNSHGRPITCLDTETPPACP